tara:strand:+ start:521 stop:760 length:240 start_codon:yes stop_codon:yes gene_type:complete
MANNQANDRYNPPGNMHSDFESFRWSEIPVGQLFWRYDDTRGNNYAFRKLNDDMEENSLQTKSQQVVTIGKYDMVYQKI